MLVGSLIALVAIAAFFLIRPLLGPLPAYGPRPAGTTYSYVFVVVGAFFPYGAAVWAARRGAPLVTALVGAALLSLILLPSAITQSQDVFAYLFYGKLWVVHGANPYVVPPEAFASDPWFAWVRWPDQVSVYGPLWTLLSAGIVRAAGESIGLALAVTKVVTAGVIAAALGALIVAARGRGEDPGRAVVLFGWNPLVLVSVALGAHADGAIAALVLWALVADRRRRPVTAALLLAAAALVKAYAALFLLVYLVALALRRRSLLPAVGAGAALTVAAFAPLWAGLGTFEGLIGIAGRASSSLGGGVERLLAAVAGQDVATWAVRIVGLAVVLLVLLVAARRDGFAEDPWPAAVAVFAAYLLVTPWFLYWHQVSLLALAAMAASPGLRAGAFAFSGTSLLTISGGGGPWGTTLQTAARYGVPLAAAGVARRRASALGSGSWVRESGSAQPTVR